MGRAPARILHTVICHRSGQHYLKSDGPTYLGGPYGPVKDKMYWPELARRSEKVRRASRLVLISRAGQINHRWKHSLRCMESLSLSLRPSAPFIGFPVSQSLMLTTALPMSITWVFTVETGQSSAVKSPQCDPTSSHQFQ